MSNGSRSLGDARCGDYPEKTNINYITVRGFIMRHSGYPLGAAARPSK